MSYAKTTATRKIANLTKRIRIVQGGTSASKTISILIYLIVLAQNDTKPTITSIVAESVPHLKRGAMRDFKKIMQEHGYWKDKNWNVVDSTYTFENKSLIEFFSTDNGDKLRGARRDRTFMNEANNCTFDAFEQLEVRTNEFIIIDFNPTNEFWAFTEVEGKRNDVEKIVLTYKDNEACPPEIVASIEQRRNRPGWFKVYGEGQLGEVEGRIYKNWQIIDEIPHEARLERYGLDFGYTNDPTAIVALYYYNGGYILNEIAYAQGMSNRQIADILTNLPRALVIADSAEPKSIDEIKSFGVSILPTLKGKDSVRQKIQIVQDQAISVTKGSVNILKEYRNFLWKMDKDGHFVSPNEPEHEYKHSMDAIAYAISSLVPIVRQREAIRSMGYGNFEEKDKNPAL